MLLLSDDFDQENRSCGSVFLHGIGHSRDRTAESMSWRSPDWLLRSSKPCSHMRAYGQGLTAAVWASWNHVIYRVHAVFVCSWTQEEARRREEINLIHQSRTGQCIPWKYR